jgi:trehalose 6-phosphate phosphatase
VSSAGHNLLDRVDAIPLVETLLVTDFDGTLAHIVPNPPAAAARPDSLRSLAILAGLGLRVAVLSGRPTSFLEAHLSIAGAMLLGNNGLQTPSPDEIRALGVFNELAAARIAQRPGVSLVTERGSSTVHFRAAPEVAAELYAEMSSLAESLELSASTGRMVVEVRPRRATKGRALEELILALSPKCVVFAGDDEGDRDAFDVLSRFSGVHLAIGIRSYEATPDLFAACDIVYDDPAGLATFLSEWITRIEASP